MSGTVQRSSLSSVVATDVSEYKRWQSLRGGSSVRLQNFLWIVLTLNTITPALFLLYGWFRIV